MKIYFAGSENKNNAQLLNEENVLNIFSSFIQLKKVGRTLMDVIKQFNHKIDLGIDCGAFSGYVNVYEYVEFIQKYKKFATFYTNADVIYNPKASEKNQEIMESYGLNPVPIFHFSEKSADFAYFERMVREYDYVGLGGSASVATKPELRMRNFNWHRKCFDLAMKYKTKIHGCGIFAEHLLRSFPFYSVDTTDWMNGNKRGIIIVPNGFSFKKIRFEKNFASALLYKQNIQKLGIDFNNLVDDRGKNRLNIRTMLWFENTR